MRKFLLFLFSLVIGFAIFWLVIRSIGWQDIVQTLSLFRHWQGIIIFLITLLMAILNIWRWQIILKEQRCNFPLTKLSDIWLAGSAITYLTPIALLGGEFFLGFGLHKKFNLSWEKGIASIIIFRILNLSITLLFLVLGIFSFLVLVGLPPEKVILIAVSTILGLSAILALFYYRSFRKKSVLELFFNVFGKKSFPDGKGMIDTEKEVFSFFRPKNKAMWQSLFGLALPNAFLNLVRFWFIIFFLKGKFIGLLQMLAIFAFVHIAYILPLPAALGSLEASQAYVFETLGLGAELGTAFSLILRGAELSIVLIGLFFLAQLWIKFRAFAWLLEKFGITKKE